MRMSYARSSQRNGSTSSAVYEEGAEILKRPVSPLPKGQFRLRQLSNLPRLPAAAVPVDPLLAERCETQGQIASIKALGVPTDCDDRLAEIAAGQFGQLAAQAILHLVGEAAAAQA